ncbi:MAG: Cro/CI family transcriptional regulator [Beijerinckiaceae bacterium]
MRDEGLQEAIEKAGGVSALARAIGVAQPSISNWDRVPAERVPVVEAVTGVPREILRPDLFGGSAVQPDDMDATRALEYRLIASLFAKAPDAALLARIARLTGDATPLGMAHIALADAADGADAEKIQREYFHLFIGLGRGEFLPFASWYLTGFLHDRPLARVREDMANLGIAAKDDLREPEDHIAILCDVMAGLCDGSLGVTDNAKAFFERHIKPWAARFFADVENAADAAFYSVAARTARVFIEIETDAYGLPN